MAEKTFNSVRTFGNDYICFINFNGNMLHIKDIVSTLGIVKHMKYHIVQLKQFMIHKQGFKIHLLKFK